MFRMLLCLPHGLVTYQMTLRSIAYFAPSGDIGGWEEI
ncbi:hypothetical protein XACM_1679 [Xanthomonas euvesicatoria pv. citrumelo F1]|nr:hypothetical protein XACM_1679 [Xanthomonas euvesicatoria pv. citrumelo F1]